MDQVYNFLKKTICLKEHDRVVVGVSAGPDSMALLHILKKLQKDIGYKIIVAHINHNVRKESVEEASFLEEYCLKNDLIFESMTIEKYGDDNFHNEARNIRYNFYRRLIDKYQANYLMTGHHGDDLIETILMRITRGSNIKGYSGFQIDTQKEGYRIIRPLIYLTKDNIIEYNSENNIPSVEDKSNVSSKYTRNRYRKKVLPFLKEENKHVHLKYLKFSSELYDYYNFVDEEVTKELAKRYKDNVLDISNYDKLPKLLQTKIIEKILNDNYEKNLYLVSDKHLYLILDIINNSRPNIQIDLPDNLKVKKSYNKLKITRNKDDNQKYHVIISKSTLLPNGHYIEMKSSCNVTNNFCTRLSSQEVKLPLFVRNREVGDRMTIKNMKSSKKLKDIFIDSKVSKEQRREQPVVVDSDNNIIWLPGLKKSQFDKAKDDFYDIILWYN